MTTVHAVTSGSGAGLLRRLGRLTRGGSTGRHDVIDDRGHTVLTVEPAILRTQRTGHYELGGPWGAGRRLERTRHERLRLLDGDGIETASFRGRAARLPGLRRRLEVRTHAVELTLEERALRSTIDTMQRDLRGETVAQWHGSDGLHVDVGAAWAQITWTEAFPGDDVLAVVAGVVAWRLTHPAEP